MSRGFWGEWAERGFGVRGKVFAMGAATLPLVDALQSDTGGWAANRTCEKGGLGVFGGGKG